MKNYNPTLDVLRGAKGNIGSDYKTTKLMLEGLVSAYENGMETQGEPFNVDTLVRQLVGIIGDLENRILNLEKQIETPNPTV